MGIKLAGKEQFKGKEHLKQLYRVDVDQFWNINKIRKIESTLGGVTVGADQGLEDARLFAYGNNVWMCATIGGHTKNSWPVFGMLEEDRVRLGRPVYAKTSPQKNWMPFVLNGQLYLEYSINPHIVLSFDPLTGQCIEIAQGRINAQLARFEIHGGAPALRYTASSYLGLANTQERFWYQERYYGAVFYLFNAEPPFTITHMSRPLRIGSRKERVSYAAGMLFSGDRNSLLVSIGLCDCDNIIVSLSIKDIMAKLKPVEM